jgi:hypothetical protein
MELLELSTTSRSPSTCTSSTYQYILLTAVSAQVLRARAVKTKIG